VFAGANGTFTFSRIPAGRYVLCAQVAPAEAAPANSPYIDTCDWGSAQPPITLAAGQQVAGIVFTAPKGAWLKIRVVDPEHALPQAVPTKGPSALDPQLQLIVKGPDGLHRHARFASSDAAGRNYQMVVPLNTALGLKAASSVASISDQAGKPLQEKDEVGVRAATPADLAPLTFTLHRGGH
jgi:hypothetical protein